MASTFATVKLNRRLVDEARREAELFHRSLAGQIEHWAQLGRAIENAQGVPLERVRAALRGELKIEDLPEPEQEAFFAELGTAFEAPSPALEAGYAKLGQARAAAKRRRTGGARGSRSAA